MASEIAERIAERAYSNTTQLSVTERREMEAAVDEELVETRKAIQHLRRRGHADDCDNCAKAAVILRQLDPAKGTQL